MSFINFLVRGMSHPKFHGYPREVEDFQEPHISLNAQSDNGMTLQSALAMGYRAIYFSENPETAVEKYSYTSSELVGLSVKYKFGLGAKYKSHSVVDKAFHSTEFHPIFDVAFHSAEEYKKSGMLFIKRLLFVSSLASV